MSSKTTILNIGPNYFKKLNNYLLLNVDGFSSKKTIKFVLESHEKLRWQKFGDEFFKAKRKWKNILILERSSIHLSTFYVIKLTKNK